MAAGSVNANLPTVLDLTERLYNARQQVTRLENQLRNALRGMPQEKSNRYCYLIAPDRTVWSLEWGTSSVYIKKVEVEDCLMGQEDKSTPSERGANAVRLDDDPLDF